MWKIFVNLRQNCILIFTNNKSSIHMKKFFLSAFAVLTLSVAGWAVASRYASPAENSLRAPESDALTEVAISDATSNGVIIANADFSEGAVGDGITIFTTESDVTTGNVCHLQTVPGWEFGVENKDGISGGVMAYGSGAMIGKNKADFAVPAEGPEGSNGKALALAANWTNSAQYTQQIKLPAGKYTMTVKLINTTGTSSVTKNLMGVKVGTAEYFATATTYEVGKWIDEVIEFEMAEEGAATLSLGYQSANTGTTTNPHIFIDNVTIEAVPDVVEFTNSDFAKGAVGDGVVIFTTAADVTEGNVVHLQEVPGWTFGVENKDGMSGGVMAYGSGAMIGKGDKPAYTVPAQGPEGTNGYALALAANNSNTAQYVQDVELTAGKYTMTATVMNTVGTEAVTNLIGVQVDGTGVYADATTFEVGKWVDHVVEFEVATSGTVTVSVGFKVGSGGTSNKPHLFVDNVKIVRLASYESVEPAGDPVRLALTGGSGAGDELAIKVLKEDENGNPLMAKYTVTNGTWGNNASHLSFFKYKFTAEQLADVERIGVQFAEAVPASNGDATYGFIPVGLVSPVNWTSMSGKTEWEYTVTGDDKTKGIDDFSLFFNASGDLKNTEITITGLYLLKAGQTMPDPDPIKDVLDVTGFEDLTAKIANPNFNDGTNGWTVNSGGDSKGSFEVKAASTGNPVVTAYNYLLDISQNIEGLQPGKYAVLVNACSRHMDGVDGIKDYETKKAKGEEIQNEAYVYANGIQKKVMNIYDETADYDFASESNHAASDLTMSNKQQIPYNSTNFSNAFGKLGMYENYVICTVGKNGILTLGIKNELQASGCTPYIAFDNFRLYRMGDADEEEGAAFDLYDLMAEAGTYVPVCMPYAVKSEYFGQVYKIAEVQNGQAVLVPTDAVATGEPCVIKANGEHNIKEGDVELSYNAPKATLSMWDNTMLQGNLSKLTWTATSVDGTVIKAADLTYTEADLSNMKFTCTIENNAAARFWAQNPDYMAETPTIISKYLNLPTYNRTDQPNPVSIPVVAANADQTLTYCLTEDMIAAETLTIPAGTSVVELYNLLPGLTYYYKTADGKSAGQFTVGGKLRMIMIGKNVVNMRDLGGKKTVDGRYVKYGKLFRNAEFKGGTFNITDAELQMLLGLNIGAELDLRNEDGNKPWLPNAKRGDNFYWAQGKNYIANGPGKMYDETAKTHLKAEFELIVNNLKKGVAVDFHCRIGADRTGFLAFLLEGLLGVTETDMLLDYETTSFSEAGLRTKADGDGDAAASSYEKVIPAEFRSKIPAGGTLRDVFDDYFINTLGVDKALVEEYREIMLGDSPLPDIEHDLWGKYVNILYQEIGEASQYVFGDELGQYTVSDQSLVDNYLNAAKNASDFLENVDYSGDGVKRQIIALTAARKAMQPAISLNMPKAGDQLYLMSKAYGKYIVPRDKNWTVQTAVTEKCLFTSDGQGLVHVTNGTTFAYDEKKGRVTAVKAEEGVAPVQIVPSLSGTVGCYNILIDGLVVNTVKTTGSLLTAQAEANTDADIVLVKYVPEETAIRAIETSTQAPAFNLAGQQVNTGYKGIVVRNGKKVILK